MNFKNPITAISFCILFLFLFSFPSYSQTHSLGGITSSNQLDKNGLQYIRSINDKWSLKLEISGGFTSKVSGSSTSQVIAIEEDFLISRRGYEKTATKKLALGTRKRLLKLPFTIGADLYLSRKTINIYRLNIAQEYSETKGWIFSEEPVVQFGYDYDQAEIAQYFNQPGAQIYLESHVPLNKFIELFTFYRITGKRAILMKSDIYSDPMNEFDLSPSERTLIDHNYGFGIRLKYNKPEEEV